MSVDYTKVQLLSSASSNKVYKEGAGSFVVAALGGSGETFNLATIPHGFATSDLIYQVTTLSGVSANRKILPWAPGDNRQIQFAAVDATNLYIYFISTDSSGLGAPSYTVTYTYKILVP
jgi:hypothetical protein